VGTVNGGVFGGGQNDNLDTWGGRFDMDAGLVWTWSNLGAGNRALVRQRAAQQQKALIEWFNLQDQVAQEVVQAHAQLQAAADQVGDAEIGAKEAAVTFRGNLRGIGQTKRAGDLLQLVNRPQEAVAALQQLIRSYESYFAAINNYNRAQFQLYHALGYPSRIVAWERPAGEVLQVDTDRPAQMAPVCPHVLSSPDR
jgi:outer membrane protein TolC